MSLKEPINFKVQILQCKNELLGKYLPTIRIILLHINLQQKLFLIPDGQDFSYWIMSYLNKRVTRLTWKPSKSTKNTRKNIPISKIRPKEVIYFSSNISKEKFLITCSDFINKYMKLRYLNGAELVKMGPLCNIGLNKHQKHHLTAQHSGSGSFSTDSILSN